MARRQASSLHLGGAGRQWPKIDNPSAVGADQLLEHCGLELGTTVKQLGQPVVGLDRALLAFGVWMDNGGIEGVLGLDWAAACGVRAEQNRAGRGCYCRASD